MPCAREVPGFDCEEPFAAASARVVEVRAAQVFAHSGSVLDLEEIARLHDMRVATRRLHAALEVFDACFPRKRHRRVLKRVKELADALGERRDRDVSIEFLTALEAETPQADRPGLAALLERLREEQREASEALAPYVKPKRLRKLRRRLPGGCWANWTWASPKLSNLRPAPVGLSSDRRRAGCGR